jgi:hypothetical protein
MIYRIEPWSEHGRPESKQRRLIEGIKSWTYLAQHWNDQVYTNFINMYLKMKQEASDYPPWVKTAVDLLTFKEYFEAEGIELEHIEKDMG